MAERPEPPDPGRGSRVEGRAAIAAALADRYRIERELGEGGMATVYLAEDLKHRRQVAIKVLKPELAAVLGAERFVQEIATTAQLQHPNILPLFDSGRTDGFLYYVMPYIEGESLRDRLNREKQLGVGEAVRLAVEVAGALDYAHRHGVVHRDIKPENILLHDGRPMVADFGIALAVSAAAGGRMTETGLSLGTPHYMSPEQATAEKEITGRSDIYSLGAVLYEMLTGEPPHTGSTAQQIIAKIVTEEAARVTEVRRSVPGNVAAAVATSLEKLPADRFESAQAFAAALTDPHFTGARGATTSTMPRHAYRRLVGALAVASVMAALMSALALWGWLRPPPRGAVTRYRVTLAGSGPGGNLPMSGADFVRVAISPDGSAIVYSERSGRLLLKRRGDADGRPLTGAEGVDPFFSPDGAWVGFFQRGELRKVPSTGGSAVTVADSAYAKPPVSGAWLRFISGRPTPGATAGARARASLWSKPADGSADARLLWSGPQDVLGGSLSPDGRWLILQTEQPTADILAVRPGTDSTLRPLAATRYYEVMPAVSPDSRWLAYVSDETGTNQVFVSPFPETNRGKWQISSGGGIAPHWAHHGHELLYWAGDQLVSVTIRPGPPFSVGERRVLFTRPAGVRRTFDITPDDQLFIMVRDVPAAQTATTQLILVENFFQELRAKLRK